MKKLKMVSVPEDEWFLGVSESARQDFNLALESVAKVRFFEDFYIEDGVWDRGVKVPPKHIGLCGGPCDAGAGCCHKFVRKKIQFCVY